jgi:hypothetical protein
MEHISKTITEHLAVQIIKSEGLIASPRMGQIEWCS